MARNRRAVRRPGSGTQLMFVAVTVSIVVPLTGWLFLEKWWGGAEHGGPLTCSPQLATFVNEVVQTGTVESASNVDILCEVNARGFYRTTILELIPEGSYVEPGDFLMRLDSAPLERLRVRQLIECNTQEAALVKAENTLETCHFALREYIDGLLPKQQRTLGNDLARARQKLHRAEQTLSLSESMYRRGYVTRMSLEADRFAADQAKLELTKAETKLNVLEAFSSKKRLKDLESSLAIAEANVKWRRHLYELSVQELENLEKQIANCEITAPMAGQVVYAHLHHDGHSHMIEPGESVWQKRPLVRLPNSKEMIVKVQIREDKVVQVRPGLEARIELEAFPGAELRGKVTALKEFPSQTEWWGPKIKAYEATIQIDRESIDAEGVTLRPGLSAKVRIRVDEQAGQLLLPFQAVFRHNDQHYCIIHDRGGFRAKPIEIGGTNGKFLAVRTGLEEHERVVLGAANYRAEVGMASPIHEEQ